MLTLAARLALGLVSAAVVVSDPLLLAVFLATFLAVARGFFSGAVAESSAGLTRLARAGFAAGAESDTAVLLSDAALGLGGALVVAFAAGSEVFFTASVAVEDALARGLRGAFGLAGVAAAELVNEASLTGAGLAGAAACLFSATGTWGVGLLCCCSAGGALALRCSLLTLSLCRFWCRL